MSTAIKKKDDDAVIEEEQPISQNKVGQDGGDIEQSFDINPLKKKCRYCNIEVVTYVEHETHPLFLLIALILMFIFGFLSVIMIPVAFLVSKSAIHRCSRCLQRLGEKKFFGLPDNFSNDIWQFRLGKCAIVVSRTYAIIILTIFAIFACSYVYMRPSYYAIQSPYEVPTESKEISYSWENFLKDCGGEVIVENYVHARSVFNRKYENNVVTWTGYYAEQKQTNSLPFFPSEHSLNILVKMYPTESALYPDLVLSVPSSLHKDKRQVISSLKKGEELQFKAKVVSLGNEFKMHHLHAIEIQKTGNFKEFAEILIRESALP